MNVTIRQMRAFAAVNRFQSFTKAATLLHLTQPALTVQIRLLERACGQKLFDRTTRQVGLTAAGRELAPVFQHLLRDLDAALAHSHDIAAKRVGTIRLACLPSVAASFLPGVIARFRALHPNVRFVLHDQVGKRIVEDVRQEVVDFGITDVDVDAPDLQSDLLLEENMHVFFPRGHPIETCTSVTIDQLARYPLVLMSLESNARSVIDMAFVQAGLTPRISCEVIYMSTAIGMVQAGLGLTVLPSMGVALSSVSTLSSRRVDDLALTRRIAVVFRKDRSLPPAAKAFVEMLTSSAPDFPGHTGVEFG